MKNDKSKNIIIGLLLVIIIILGALVILFATDILSFNSNTIQENIKEQEKIQEDSSIVGYYQEIINNAQDSYVIREFKLNPDNTVNYIIGGSHNENYTDASIVRNYTGTYLKKNNKIILSITSTDDNCIGDKYACIDIITLSRQNDGKLVGSDSLTETYDKVENLLLIK